MKSFVAQAAAFLLICFVLLACIGFPFAEVPLLLAFGWILFLLRTSREISVEPAAYVVAGMSLLLFVAILHRIAGWLYGHFHANVEPAPRWRLRWSLSITGLVVFAFAAGIALLGTVHEGYWLFTSDQPYYSYGQASRRSVSTNNLKQIGLAFHNYHEINAVFPAGGTFDQYGEMGHSWETHLLPYLESPVKPDLAIPWNHPDNAPCFKTSLPAFLNPGMQGRHEADQSGYALSHYAANGHVLRANSKVSFAEITDGTSNTILAGEVRENFQPWGHPVNWRDPAAGINQSPQGFGGPWQSNGASILLFDGSVRFLSAETSPEVLKALSTPAAGDKIKINADF